MEKFTCAVCDNEYDKINPDDVAIKECRDMFGDMANTPLAIVCDDCWLQMGFGEDYGNQ